MVGPSPIKLGPKPPVAAPPGIIDAKKGGSKGGKYIACPDCGFGKSLDGYCPQCYRGPEADGIEKKPEEKVLHWVNRFGEAG